MHAPTTRGRGRLIAASLAVAVLFPPSTSAAQEPVARPDSVRRDSVAAQPLTPIEVIGSILSVAGPAVASGVPARTSVVARDR
ncbi:MAG TPA: hypothetical protein VFX39_06990, partial [Gemmatimonadaceae bacterium]|nr:hypothetical protein [Gemmatimonadaceae bacterium]